MGTQLLLFDELLGELRRAFDARQDAIEADREALREKAMARTSGGQA